MQTPVRIFTAQTVALFVLVAVVLLGPRKLPELGRLMSSAFDEMSRVRIDFKIHWWMLGMVLSLAVLGVLMIRLAWYLF